MDVRPTPRETTLFVVWNFLLWRGLSCGGVNQTDTSQNYTATFQCPLNLTTRSFSLMKEIHEFRHQTSFAFAVKACKDAYVTLGFKNETARADIYLISLGGSQKNESFVTLFDQRTSTNAGPLKNSSISLLSCEEFRVFNISWTEDTLVVNQQAENGTITRLILNGSQYQTNINYVVLSSWSVPPNNTAEWKIDAACKKSKSYDTEEPATVSQGHLGGAVTAALIIGILLGGVAVYFGPDLWIIAKDRLPALRKRKEKTKDVEDVLDTFERKRSTTPDKSSIKQEANPEDKTEAELPGRRRAPSNAYTPCTVTRAAPPPQPTAKRPVLDKAAGVRPTEDVKSPRDAKPAGEVRRVPASGSKSKKPSTTKASVKPKKGKAKAEEEEAGEIYANEETNVYEGMKRDVIYENRNTDMYESLNAGK